MKKITFSFILLIMIFSLTGCFKITTDTDLKEKNETTDKTDVTVTEIPKDKESCEKANGIWGTIGLAPFESCNLKTTDGGKQCKSSDDCDGSCLGKLDSLHDAEKLIGKEADGECSYVMTIVGCRAFIEKGKVDRVLCID